MVDTKNNTKTGIDAKSNVYFQNKYIREYLINSGFINRHGDILPVASNRRGRQQQRTKEKRSKSNTNGDTKEDEHRRQLVDLVSKRIPTEKKITLTRSRRDISSRSIRVQQERKSNSEDLSPSKDKKRSLIRAKSAHHLPPPNAHEKDKNRPGTALPSDNSRYRVVMIYYGSYKAFDFENNRFHSKGDKIVVSQQHHGSEKHVVFKDYVKPNQIFAFNSRHQQDLPFALAMYVNGLTDCRISVSCESKHQRHAPLGGKNGSFGIYSVQRVKPRFSGKDKKRKKKVSTTISANLDPSRYRESVMAPFPPPPNRSNSSDIQRTACEPPLPSLMHSYSPILFRTPTPPNPEVDKKSPLLPADRPPPLISADHNPKAYSTTSSEQSGKELYASDFDETSEEEEQQSKAPSKSRQALASNTQRIDNQEDSDNSFKSSTSVTRISVPMSLVSHGENGNDHRSPRRIVHSSPSPPFDKMHPSSKTKPETELPTKTYDYDPISTATKDIESRGLSSSRIDRTTRTATIQRSERVRYDSTSSAERSFWDNGLA